MAIPHILATCLSPTGQPVTKSYWSPPLFPQTYSRSLLSCEAGFLQPLKLPDLGHRMKARFLIFGLLVTVLTSFSARAGSLSYARCGTYDAYLLVYKSTDKFEELGKLRCGEQVEVLARADGYSQIRTLDDRLGWVRDADLTEAPPPPQKVFTFGLTEQPKIAAPASAPAPDPAPVHSASLMSNDDVLSMYSPHSNPDLILNKIHSSRCAFDTSPEAIQILQVAGLPDTVILAMLEAPVASESSARQPEAPEDINVKIPDGTAIDVELNTNAFSAEAQEGAIVEMSAAEDLVVDGVLVVLRGSPARARIMAVKQAGSRGEVAWFMQDIVAVNGDHIPVTFSFKQPGNLHPRNFAGYPFFVSEFHQGGATAKPGDKGAEKRFRAIIHGDTTLAVAQPLSANLPAAKPKTQSLRQVSTQTKFESQPQPALQPEAAPPSPAPDEVKP
jgi:hypothetical protein